MLVGRAFCNTTRSLTAIRTKPGLLCECGCGLPAPIAKRNDTRIGLKKGLPRRFVVGHDKRLGTNPALIIGEILVLTLARKGRIYHCIVDKKDYDIVKPFWWSVHKGRSGVFYARTSQRKVMHRMLFPAAKEVDHWDGSGLNNRRYNLRDVTRIQNQMNQKKKRGGSSRFKGVSRRKNAKKWAARIVVNDKRLWLGVFASETKAAKAYDAAAKKYFGEFARLNFPEVNS
jgi:hypothetical protein